jgi:hypothetical protein
MCDVPSTAVFCSESIQCFPGISSKLTCICLRSHLFRKTLEISQAGCNIEVTPGTLTATDTCIRYHVTRFEASQKSYPSYALRKHMCGERVVEGVGEQR